jgi:hypothetical protein
MRNRWVVATAVAAATLLPTTGCSSSFFEPMADPVGSWSMTTADWDGTLDLRSDHTFTAEGVPQTVACTHDLPASNPDECQGSYPVAFSGTWTLVENNPIEIFFFNGDTLVMSGVRSGKTLGFWVGDRERPEPTYEYIHD